MHFGIQALKCCIVNSGSEGLLKQPGNVTKGAPGCSGAVPAGDCS